MSEGSAGGRRYDDDEVARILKRATEIRSESTAVSRSRPQDGLTLRELEEIAGEAGIDVAHLRQAALELEAGVTAEGWGQRYVGGPWTLVREATVEGELDDDGFQAMVSAVQTTLTEPGFPSLVGRTMSWKNEAQKAGGRSTMITVTSRRGTTTIRVEENLQQVAGGFHGGITAGGGVGIGVGLGVPVAVAQGSLLLGLGIPLGFIALGWAVARTSYRAYLRRRSRAISGLLARLVEVAEVEVRPPEGRLPSGG